MSVAAMAMDEHRPLMNSYDKMSKSYEQNQGAGVSSAVGGGVGSAPSTPNAGHLSGPASPTPSGSDEPGVINAAYHIYSHHPQQHQQQHFSHHFQHQQRQHLLKSSAVSGPASPRSPMEITESVTPLSSVPATSVAVAEAVTATSMASAAVVAQQPTTTIISLQNDQQQQPQLQQQQQQQHFNEASAQDAAGAINAIVAASEQRQRKLEGTLNHCQIQIQISERMKSRLR